MSIPGIIKRNTLNALAQWIESTRQHAPLLDDEADTLLARLQLLAFRSDVLEQLPTTPRTLGLYGHSRAGKAHLLSALAGSPDGRISVAPGGKHLDYLTHINPGHNATALAIRFSARQGADLSDDYPLRLTLLSEGELVQLFIAHYYASGAVRPLSDAEIQQRLAPLWPLSQPQSHQAISAAGVSAIAAFWREQARGQRQTLSEATWHQFATLLPQLNLPERARACALLWGEQRELTRQWLALAETLQLVGHVRSVAAPLSLLVDNFSLPVEGFLLAGSEPEGNDEQLLVRPAEGVAVSLSQRALALLAAEVELPLADAPLLSDVDLLDIPASVARASASLAESKNAFLLERYRQHQQPDVLMVCNAAQRRSDIPPAARALLRWVQATQPVSGEALPGLVWAITPFDARFQAGQHLDEGIQRLLGKPGQAWGTLQALDTRNMQRLTQWLAQALSDSQRQQRIRGLQQQLSVDIQALFTRYLSVTQVDRATAKSEAENGVRALQRQAARHGDLLEALLPETSALQALCTAQPEAAEATQELFSESIDLFGEPSPASQPPQLQSSSVAHRAHALWVNHLRQWSQQPENARQADIDPEVLRWLGETLIIASYRLAVPQRLEALANDNALSGAGLRAALANFLSWLGYSDTPLAARPASRVNPGNPIFAPVPVRQGRLTQLAEQPVHAATRYVYDWLVALYTLACDNIGYRHPLDIQPADRQRLAQLLSGH